MLLLPFVFVSAGALLGWLVVVITNPPENFRKGTIAAVAFGNSTGMPIVLLSVLRSQLELLRGASSSTITNGTLKIRDPIVYLSVYLLTYPIIQWVAGGWLLAPKEEVSDAPTAPPSTGVQSADGSLASAPSGSMPPLPIGPDFLMQITDGEISATFEARLASRRSRVRSQDICLQTGSSAPLTLSSAREDATMIRDALPSSAPLPSMAPINGHRVADHGKMVESLVERDSGIEQRSSWRTAARDFAAAVHERVLVPPVIGVLCGLLCSSLPPSYYLLCGGEYNTQLSGTQTCPMPNALLGFFTRAVAQIGDAAVPLNLILLGNSLSKGPDWNALPVRCNVGIVVAKMLLMPTFAVSLMLLLDFIDKNTGFLPLKDPYDEVFYLAAAAVTATPTANNMMVMIEVAGGDKTAMATAIFSQYMVAPLVLTGSLTVIIAVFQQYG